VIFEIELYVLSGAARYANRHNAKYGDLEKYLTTGLDKEMMKIIG
jgi:hypothetical protein